MSLQTVPDLSDAVVLESNLGLYLKPVTRIKINVLLPKLTLPGQSISSWNVMEKLRATVRPDTFLNLKALKITSTVIKFEGELECKAACERALARLRAANSLKLSGFSENLQVRAAHSAESGPKRHDWEAFFRDAKGVNEMKPGERPDTIHLQELPVRWFCEGSKNGNPNEKLLKFAFGTFGKVRRLEIPSKGGSGVNTIGKTNSLHKDLLFEVYIQYEEYVEFAIAMDSLRGKKLLYKESNGKVYSADIKVDFDRTRYLSEACIRKREAEEKKLNPVTSIEEEKKTTKEHHSSQAKPELQGPAKKSLSTEAPDSLVHSAKEPDSNVKESAGNVILEDKKKSQLEAELLLKELLLRAEVTERQKEQAKAADHKQLNSQKRSHQSSSPNVSSDKKIKVVKEHYKEIEEKIKHSIEKRALSEDRKFSKSTTKESREQHHEKRIKTEIKNDNLKEKNMSPDKRKKEKSTRSDEDKHKSRTPMSDGKHKKRDVQVHSEKESKGYKSSYNNEKKLKEKDYHERTEGYDSHRDKKHREKETLVECDKKTSRDYKNSSNYEKRHKERDTITYYEKTIENFDTVHRDKKRKEKEAVEYCDETKEDFSSKRKKKQKDCQILEDSEKNSKKSKGEIDVEKEEVPYEEEKRMYMEEQKIKERLIQAYNQKKRNEAKLLEQERILKEKLLRNMKERERAKLKEREKLRRELSGQNVLKSVLGSTNSSSYKKR